MYTKKHQSQEEAHAKAAENQVKRHKRMQGAGKSGDGINNPKVESSHNMMGG